MMYVQQFHQNRQNNLKEYQRLRSSADQNFLLCSDDYTEKLTQLSQPTTHTSTPNRAYERSRTLLILTRIPSLLSLNNNNNSDLSILNVKSTSWKPQTSRITRDNKDYMTALAKGLARDDRQQLSTDSNEVFSSRWHHRPLNTLYRPATGKPSSIGSRPPTSATERGKMSSLNVSDNSRPTTAPVIIETRSRRVNTGKVRPVVATTRPTPPPPPPPPPPVQLRVPRVIESSGNFDNLTNSTFHQLAGGLKPSIFKSNNHFVHQLCSNTNDDMIDPLDSTRDSFLDISNRTPHSETTNTKLDLIETIEIEQEENQNNVDTWQRDSNSERIEGIDDLPILETPRDADPEEIEQPTMEQEDDEDILQRENDIDQYPNDLGSEASVDVYDYKSPFTEEYERAISSQSQFQTNNGNNDPSLRDFYRDNRIKSEQNTNIKTVFEKCVKLARLQANTVKWEQRRRQNLITYNRLLKNSTLEASTSNFVGSLAGKNNNNNEKESRELNELKRDLRCNECKRVTCLGNCAPGQNYHLYKRIVSSIPSQSPSSRQLSTPNGSNSRDQHRCKHGYTTCPISACRTTADIINNNAIITSLNNNNNNNNRIRSSRTTFSYGNKSQRSTVDLRPRSVRHVTREMKFEQANLSPVVVVPLFEDESRSMLTKNSQQKSTNGLLPGKSFRSQRRDSLTMVSPQKMTS